MFKQELIAALRLTAHAIIVMILLMQGCEWAVLNYRKNHYPPKIGNVMHSELNKPVWQDTKKVAKQLAISNPKLLATLDKKGNTTKINGQRTMNPQYKKLARNRQGAWIYSGSDRSAHGEQPYYVVQLSEAGIQQVKAWIN